MSKPKRQEEGAPPVPAYIVTFSDMVTLLLTFFVLLLSMANTQDEAKFKQGQESIERALATYGLSGLMQGKINKSNFEYKKLRYPVDHEEEKEEDLSRDHQYESLKEVVYYIEKLATVSPSKIMGENPHFVATNVRFEESSDKLTPEAHEAIQDYCIDLGQNLSQDKTVIYIVGFSRNCSTQKDNMIVSSKRAKVVYEHFKELLPENPYWEFYYWGAGEGGNWTKRIAYLDEKSHVAVAILTAE